MFHVYLYEFVTCLKIFHSLDLAVAYTYKGLLDYDISSIKDKADT